MEFLNKIELKGIVGIVQCNPVKDCTVYRFQLVTEYAYTDKDGSNVIDCTWFSVVAFSSDTISPDILNGIHKGSAVHVIGRLRQFRYCTVKGVEQRGYEVFAQIVELINR